MSSLVLFGDTSGSISLTANSIAGSNTLTVPALTGTLLTTATPGAILQVVSTTKSNVFSTTTTGSWVDITGLSASITPKSATSKVLVFYTIGGASTGGYATTKLVRNSTDLAVGTSGNPNGSAAGSLYNLNDAGIMWNHALNYLDSPANTSSVTYKIQVYNSTGGTTTYINTSTNGVLGGSSSITLMEVAA